MDKILLIFSMFFALIAILSSQGMLTFPIYKLGIPLFFNDARWTWFIYRKIKKAEIIDKKHLKYKDKIIVFHDSWLFEVYEGESIEEIANKYDLGGQSNKAYYLTWWQKVVGKKIERWYLLNVA